MRDQIVSDFEEERDRLEAALRRLVGTNGDEPDPILLESAGEVRLQASWAAGRLVVWAAGPGTEPASSDELEQRLGDQGVLESGWTSHPPVRLPNGGAAPALALPVGDALGWLAAVGGGHDDDTLGQQRHLARPRRGLGHPAGRRRVDRPDRAHPPPRSPAGRRGHLELSVRWAPALLGTTELDELASAMPGPVTALERADAASAHAVGPRRHRRTRSRPTRQAA